MKLTKLFLLLMALYAYSSCKKDDSSLFSELPQERVAETLTSLESTLKTGDGWVMYIFTELNDQGYSFYTQYLDSNRVNMVADIDSISGNVIKQSSYRTQWMQQPTLIFDTYNYIHRLADPNPSEGGLGGAAGSGLVSDFSFGLTAAALDSLKNTSPSSIPFVGRFNELGVSFYKASSEEANFWKTGGIWQFQKTISSLLNKLSVPGLALGSNQNIQLNFGNKNLTVTWLDGDTARTTSTAFAYGYNKIVIKDSINVFGKMLTGFVYTNNQLYGIYDGGNILITDLGSPVIKLYTILGGSVTSIVNTATTQTGTSTDFVTRRNTAATAMLNGGYNLVLGNMTYKFDSDEKTMVLSVIMRQNTTNYVATFPYTYTMTTDGIFKFTFNASGMNGNAGIIVNNLAPILAQRLNVDNFNIQYVKSSSGAWLGQFVSIEHPEFSFSGTVQ